MIDYRLAPEHPYPAAVEDAVAAYAWLREQKDGDADLQGRAAGTPTAFSHCADLSGLPPLRIHAGRDEVLHDDAVGLHERAQAAGVDSTLEVWGSMIHVWHAFHPKLDEGQRGIDRIGELLRARWSA